MREMAETETFRSENSIYGFGESFKSRSPLQGEGCRECRLGTDLLIASYTLKDPELSDAILRFLIKHAAEAGHKLSEGWVLVGRRRT